MSRNKRKVIKDLLDREVEKPVLESLYLGHGVATDQLRRNPETLLRITKTFNQITSRSFSLSELLRYMFNRRKVADWPKLGTKAKKFDSVLNLLTSSQLTTLKQIYIKLDNTSDELLFEPALAQVIEKQFFGLTGADIPGSVLIAAIFAKRKRGNWVCIREEFGDIGIIAS